MADSRLLDGQVAIVTGGVRRIGKAIALSLAREGAAIVINAKSSRDEAEAAVRDIEAIGGRAIFHLADVTDEEAVAGLVSAAIEAFGRIDVLLCADSEGCDPALLNQLELTCHEYSCDRVSGRTRTN